MIISMITGTKMLICHYYFSDEDRMDVADVFNIKIVMIVIVNDYNRFVMMIVIKVRRIKTFFFSYKKQTMKHKKNYHKFFFKFLLFI